MTNNPPTDTSATAAEESPSAKEKAANIADSGKQAAGAIAQTATDAAKDVAEQTKQQANDLLGTTKEQLGEQVSMQQGALVQTLRSLGDQLAAMTDSVRPEQDGTAVDVAGKARDRACSAADWLDRREPADVLDEVRSFGRERPGTFLLSAFAAGVVAGRLTRGVVAVHADDSSDALQVPASARYDATPERPSVSPTPAQPGIDR